MVATTASSAVIEMPLDGATREPTHRPSSGAAVHIEMLATAIPATRATRSSRTFTCSSG